MLEANRELGKLKARFPAFEFHLIPGRSSFISSQGAAGTASRPSVKAAVKATACMQKQARERLSWALPG